MKDMRILLIPVLLFILNLQAETREYSEWLERRAALKKDSSVARHYTFDGVKDANSVIKNGVSKKGELIFMSYREISFIPAEEEAPNHGFGALAVVEGRYPGEKAVRLDRGFYQGAPLHVKDKQFTAEVWFRRRKPEKAFREKTVKILSLEGEKRGWSLETSYGQGKTLSFCIGQPAGAARAEVKTLLPDDVWHHVAVTLDGSAVKVYVNGRLAEQRLFLSTSDGNLVEADGFSGEYVPSSQPFRIGWSEDGEDLIVLDVDEVIIYDRALSAEEIASSVAISAGR